MIEKLVIRNFQTHRNTVVVPDKGVTTIVGPSDVGKSAVLRALRWAALNRPGGTAFIRDGTSAVRVKVCLEDGHQIIRHRGKGKNLYIVDGKELKAFGDSVPDPVLDLLGMEPIHFQGQHDAPFWFSSTAGEVSKQLNELVDLSSIDTVLSYINSEMRVQSAHVEATERRLKEAEEERDQFEWVGKADEQLKEIEEKQERIQRLRAKREDLKKLVDRAKELKPQAARLGRALTKGLRLMDLGQKVRDLEIEHGKLSRLISSAEAQTKAANRAIPSVEDLNGVHTRLQDLEGKTDELRRLVDQGRTLRDRLSKSQTRLKKLSRQFEDQMGEECPLCRSPVKS